MENELHRQIEVKRREQHLATRGFIQKAVERQHRVGGDSKHMDIIYGIADRNRREYEYEIDCLKDKIKLLKETDPSKIFEIQNGTRLKTAYFKLTADYTSTPHDINRHVYEHTRLPNGELQMGLFQRVKNHMKDEILSAYELDNIQNLAITLPKTGNIGEFIDRYVEAYLIPQKLNRFALRAKLLRQLPLCDDVICEIFTFLNDDGICSRRMIDTRVYA
jgi:hypothetical protein